MPSTSTSIKDTRLRLTSDKPTDQTGIMSTFMRAFYTSSKGDVTTSSGEYVLGQRPGMTSHSEADDMTSPMARRYSSDVTPSLSKYLGGWLTTSAPKKSDVTVRDVNVWAPVSM